MYDDDVRLINPYSTLDKTSEGRLEVLSFGVWGSVCDIGFTHASARVACGRLGFK